MRDADVRARSTGAAAPLETPDLRLVSYSPSHLLALIESAESFEVAFGTPAADGLRDFMVSDEVSPAWSTQLRKLPAADVWTHGFGVVHRESASVVGMAGFKGPPDESGMVEIAYGIVPKFERRGLATQAAAALVAFASVHPSVKLIRAHTLPTPNASTRVLTKCGFEFVGIVEDPDDGTVWRWERSPASA